jgi:undecaprenyl-diphosphatase
MTLMFFLEPQRPFLYGVAYGTRESGGFRFGIVCRQSQEFLMDLIQAIVLGSIQGLGEFLPISSSAHLILAPWLFGWSDPGLAFDVALHFGTLVAVLLYFRNDWLAIAMTGFGRSANGFSGAYYPRNFLWLLALATIPGALIGYLLEHQAETVFRNPLLIAVTLSMVGYILFWADKRLRSRKNLEKISWSDGALIGLSQALAIIPGVSRAGATISSALLLGIDRVSAARFSFLLSTPIIFGATVLKLKDFLAAGVGLTEIVGIFTAALTGYCAIASLVKFVSTVSYKIFFWYRLALALVIVAVWALR